MDGANWPDTDRRDGEMRIVPGLLRRLDGRVKKNAPLPHLWAPGNNTTLLPNREHACLDV